MAVLESHHFHHHMWCFAMNLFDKRVMRRIVLEEEEDEDENESLDIIDERPRLSRSDTNNGLTSSASYVDDSDDVDD